MFDFIKNYFGNKKSNSKDEDNFETDIMSFEKDDISNDTNDNGEKIIDSTKTSIDKTLNGVNCMPDFNDDLKNNGLYTSHKNEITTTKGIDLTKPETTKLSLIKDNKEALSLDILDLSSVIYICAEIKAIEAFDKEIRDSKNGNIFQKTGGFFIRSFQRMGRDAWINSKINIYIDDLKEGLEKGIYSENSLREHVLSADRGIENKAFLSHEEILKDEKISVEVQQIIDDWLAIDISSEELRKSKIKELKNAIENNYPDITLDLNQLETSLIRLEKAKIQGELETIEAKLNILDIGRIENGYGERKEGVVVKTLDKVNSGINSSGLPLWFKKYVGGLVQHPNTAAVVSALATRSIISGLVGTAVISGFLAPIAVGAIAGGVLAAGRARREMRDRTTQIDRRGALGYETGNKETDGESSNATHNTANYQHSTIDLYKKIAILNTFDKNNFDYNNIKEEALKAGLYYLVRHHIGREKSLNMLQYESSKSVSSQHVDIIILLNKFFPDLVSKFNSGILFDESNNSEEAALSREVYKDIQLLAHSTIIVREKVEKIYALKQGLIYTGIAAGVGLSVSGILSMYNGHYETTGNTSSEYPDKMEAHTNVKRDFWYDNKTPTKYDLTELMIHTDKSGGWNVSDMIGKKPFTHGHTLNQLTGDDLQQAVINPVKGGPSFILPIDSQGNIQIPKSMQSAFDSRSFASLEVGKVDISATGTIDLEPIATVKGNGTMIFEKEIGEEIKKFIPDPKGYYGIPFGGNKYHELKETNSKEPGGEFIIPVNLLKTNEEKEIKEPIISNDTGKTDEFLDNSETEQLPEIETKTPLLSLNKDDNKINLKDTDYDTLIDKNDTFIGGELTILRDYISSITKQIKSIENDFMSRAKGLKPYYDLNNDELSLALGGLEMELNSKKIEFKSKLAKSKKEKLEEVKETEYKNNVIQLMNNGLLATFNDKPMMYNWNNRTFIAVKTKNGGIIPFYRSSSGTGGKNAGTWYPSFGITDDESWIIKGTLNGLENGHQKLELKNIQEKLNKSLNWPANWDSDFSYHQDKHTLTQMGAKNSNDWIKNEELNQQSIKPEDKDDGLSNRWIDEWVNRVTKNNTIL